MKPQSQIAILIYALNVEEKIQDIVSACLKASSLILVIDDGSHDDTLNRIKNFPITIIHNDFTLGKSASTIRGFAYLQPQRSKAIITIDAAEFYYFDKIDAFLEAGLKYPKHVIIGVQNPHGCLANFFMSWLVGERITDFQSSLRFLPNDIVSKTIQRIPRQDAFMLDAKLILDAKEMGYSFIRADMPTEDGRTPIIKPHETGWRFWWAIFRLLILRAFNPIGLFKSLFSRQQKVEITTPDQSNS